MSEAWGIAIGSGVLSVMTAILCWMATSLAGLRKDLRSFVMKEDCTRAMDGHCTEIRSLQACIAKNSESIARLEVLISGHEKRRMQ